MSRSPRVLVVAACAVLLATLGTASAENPFSKGRTEITLGTLIGSGDIGTITGPSAGLHVDLGKRFGDLSILGQYNFMGVGEGPEIKSARRGLMHRFGVSARYSLASFGSNFLRADFWAEAGAGREYIQWDLGGRLTRDDLTFGVGIQPTFAVGKDDGGKKRFFGYYMAFRMHVAEGPYADQQLPAICAGPCDEPTPPPTNDISLFFNFGITFGR